MLGAPEVRWKKLLLLMVILAGFSLFQIFLQDGLGWSFDLALVLLITSSFFLGFLELSFITLFSAAILMWEPGISLDMLFFILLPFAAYGARHIFSWESWIANIIYCILAICIFYFSMGLNIVFSNWILLLNLVLGGSILSVLAFFSLEYIYED